jgi:hypothetical protein
MVLVPTAQINLAIALWQRMRGMYVFQVLW